MRKRNNRLRLAAGRGCRFSPVFDWVLPLFKNLNRPYPRPLQLFDIYRQRFAMIAEVDINLTTIDFCL